MQSKSSMLAEKISYLRNILSALYLSTRDILVSS